MLKMGETNITQLLTETYKKIGKGAVTLIQVPPEKHMEINAEALRIITVELGYDCVYITLSKPFEELNKLFKSKGVDIKKLFFIDAISQLYGIRKESTKNCTYVSGPLDIDSITSALHEILSTLTSDKKCVFLDSITTVLLYNSMPRTIRFSQFLTQTLKNMEINAVMVSIAKGTATETLIKELSKLCDNIITIGAEGRLTKTKGGGSK